MMRAAMHNEMGNYNLAITDYTQAIRLNPCVWPFLTRGIVHLNMGNRDLAIADFEAVLRISPNHADAREWLDLVRH